MAGFIDVEWAPKHYKRILGEEEEFIEPGAGTYSISKSIHYGSFLAFEGIRFFVKEEGKEKRISFLNLDHNLNRFRDSMGFYLSRPQDRLVPSLKELRAMIKSYFTRPAMSRFLDKMAAGQRYGYLRPYTLDDALSIGVNFPSKPSIRMIAASFSGYLGEPFTGVLIPDIIRAVGVNGTGHLKLGINYPLGLRAIRKAREYDPEAKTALLLDDQYWKPAKERAITEWDSSCCLFGMKDGSVISIPESPLILPSVTIKGLLAIFKDMGLRYKVRDITYAELIDMNSQGELALVASVGTAGVLNRCDKLTMVKDGKIIGCHEADKKADVYHILAEGKGKYLSLYKGDVEPPEGIERTVMAV